VPKCSPNGQFEKVQCSDEEKKCWCVDIDGNEMDGTKGTTLPECPKRKSFPSFCVYRDIIIETIESTQPHIIQR